MDEQRPWIVAVVPSKNRADLLRRCLQSLVAAAQQYENARIVVSDHGSTDDSVTIARQAGEFVTVISSTAYRVGGVRNDGAAAALEADALAFIDCDCIVPPDFFAAVSDTFKVSRAAAVGCEVLSPSDGHWTERAWDGLHRPGGDGPRHYINSACFCISRPWFERIGGFDEQKISSEDVDICRRLTEAGGTMWQSERLAVLHLGNPQTVAGLYRRIRWHGEGVWERDKGIQWSVTTAATFLHLACVATGLLLGAYALFNGYPVGLTALFAGFLVVPLAFVAARALQHRRVVPIIGGVALMSITFPARLHGLFRSVMARRE
jgi:glycosyltransferase involved in cell wall biosynthesis